MNSILFSTIDFDRRLKLGRRGAVMSLGSLGLTLKQKRAILLEERQLLSQRMALNLLRYKKAIFAHFLKAYHVFGMLRSRFSSTTTSIKH